MKPCNRQGDLISIFPFNSKNKLKIGKGKLQYVGQGHKSSNAYLCHFGTAITNGPIYQREVKVLNYLLSGKKIKAKFYPFYFSLLQFYYKLRTGKLFKKKSK